MTPQKHTLSPTVELWLGDCRDVLPGLARESVDCVFTDPPYGHSNNSDDLSARWEAALGVGTPGPTRPIENDGEEATPMLASVLTELKRVLRPGCCCCCCCCGGGPDPQFARWSIMLDEVLDFKMAVVWDKGPMGMGWHYRRSYEMVLVAQKAGKCAWYDTSGKIENVIRPGAYGIRKIIPSAEDHPTPKPVELPAHFIGLHTQPEDVVLDCFAGAGSTLLAAVRMGRRAIGIELDPKHFATARRRLEAELAQGVLPLEAQQRPRQGTLEAQP